MCRHAARPARTYICTALTRFARPSPHARLDQLARRRGGCGAGRHVCPPSFCRAGLDWIGCDGIRGRGRGECGWETRRGQAKRRCGGVEIGFGIEFGGGCVGIRMWVGDMYLARTHEYVDTRAHVHAAGTWRARVRTVSSAGHLDSGSCDAYHL
ncbi:hypothetical protein BS50DRAFT_79855 [Corynespora cassiicola Philippines]|uniref:Uncharacterized protein n=1 Tax=Corynespora cassiicola Philippines TaxID=1448308 RepID=A0A2T2NI24_CORCC|nr:hypothetical protein BS50DRAFT_79855 [Corynespora cassiicola Philippines]